MYTISAGIDIYELARSVQVVVFLVSSGSKGSQRLTVDSTTSLFFAFGRDILIDKL